MSESEEFESGCYNPFCCYVVNKPIKEPTNTHGYRQIKYRNGTTYTGETKDMFFGRCREGSGKMTYKNGAVYEGGWKGDVREGYGKYTSKDGDVYEGEWKEGKIKQNRTIKKIPLDNAENIFLQNIEDVKTHKEYFTQQNTKKNKSYIDIMKGEKVPQENINKKDHLKIIYCNHGTKVSLKLKEPICDLPNANGRKSYYISNVACLGAFVDIYGNNLVDKIKQQIKGTDAVGFFSHILSNNNICALHPTIDKNNKIGLKRMICCKDGVCVNDKHFNEHKDDYIQYFVILNEGNEQNIYQIPRDLCYWREVLIDDTDTNDKTYSNKFMEAVDCLKHGKSFTFKTKAQVDIGDKLVEQDAEIEISGEMKKVEINDIIEEKQLDDESMSNWYNCWPHIEERNMNLDMNNGRVEDVHNLNANSKNSVFEKK